MRGTTAKVFVDRNPVLFDFDVLGKPATSIRSSPKVQTTTWVWNLHANAQRFSNSPHE